MAATPFDIIFDRVGSFSSARRHQLLVLRGGNGVAASAAFQKRLGEALKQVGVGPWVKPDFTPHLTLLYDDRSAPEQAVPPISCTAQELVLGHSLISRNQHVPLARWPLHTSAGRDAVARRYSDLSVDPPCALCRILPPCTSLPNSKVIAPRLQR